MHVLDVLTEENVLNLMYPKDRSKQSKHPFMSILNATCPFVLKNVKAFSGTGDSSFI